MYIVYYICVCSAISRVNLIFGKRRKLGNYEIIEILRMFEEVIRSHTSTFISFQMMRIAFAECIMFMSSHSYFVCQALSEWVNEPCICYRKLTIKFDYILDSLMRFTFENFLCAQMQIRQHKMHTLSLEINGFE